MTKRELLKLMSGFMEEKEESYLRSLSAIEYEKEWEKIEKAIINRKNLIDEVKVKIANHLDDIAENYDNITIFLALYRTINAGLVCSEELGIPLIQTETLESGYEKLYSALIVTEITRSLGKELDELNIN